MDCSRDLTEHTIEKSSSIFHWSLMCSVQGGKLKASGATTVTLPVAFNSPICACMTDILESGNYGYAPNLHEISTSSMSITCGYNIGRTSGTLWIAFGI